MQVVPTSGQILNPCKCHLLSIKQWKGNNPSLRSIPSADAILMPTSLKNESMGKSYSPFLPSSWEVINLIVDEISLARVIGGFLSCPRSPTLPTWRSKYLWWQRTILTTINHATTRLIVLSVGCFCFKKFNILTHLTRLMHSHVFCIGICLTEVTWRAPSKYKSIS